MRKPEAPIRRAWQLRAILTEKFRGIHGIPQDAYTNTEQVVIKLAEALNITVQPEDIEISHKINKGKAIIAKFVNHKAKARLCKERTRLKDVRLHAMLPRYPSTDGNRRIYLNENLMTYRRELVEEANKRKHDGTLVSVWTLDRTVYVKTSPSGSPIRIYSLSDYKICKDAYCSYYQLISIPGWKVW